MHKHQKSIIFVLVGGFIALSMLSFGVDYAGPGKQKYAIKINKEEISFDDFEIMRNRLMQQMQARFGQLYSQLISSGAVNVRQMTVDNIISQTLLTQAADQYKFGVGDSQLRKMLTMQLGQNASPEGYRALLASLNTSAQAFEAQLAEGVRVGQFQEIFNDVSSLSDQELNSLLKKELAKYSVQSIEIKPESFISKVVAPSEEVLKQRFEDNMTDYEIPDRVSYDYIVISEADALNLVSITPDDIEIYYSEHLSQYTEPEQVKLSIIALNVPTDGNPEKISKVRATANLIRENASKGKDFSELAKKYSEDPSKSAGGDLGWVKKNSVSQQLSEIYFSSPSIGVTAPIEKNGKIYILKIADYKPETTTKLADVKAEIEKKLKEREAPAYAAEHANQLYADWIDSKLDLKAFAAQKNLTLKATSDLLKSSADVDESLKGLTSKVIGFRDEKQQLIDLGKVNVIVEVTQFKEKEYPEFSAVKNEILKAYQKEEASKLAKVAAEKLVNSTEKDLAISAKAQGLTLDQIEYQKSTPAQGVLANPEASSYITNAAVMSKPSGVIAYDGNLYVLQVKKFEAPAEDKIKEKIGEYRNRFQSSDAQVLMTTFLNRLKSKSEIDVDPSLLVAES